MTAGPFLHIARDSTGVDVEAAKRAATDFLTALGIDVDHEDLRETPGRMARAYAELFSSPPLRLTTFANDEGYDELVLARAIPFRTVGVPRLAMAHPGGCRGPGAARSGIVRRQLAGAGRPAECPAAPSVS